MTDPLGSVVALTDAAGTVLERHSYSAFGIPADPAASASGNPLRFAARTWDAEIGLYDYRARVYSPTLGRFMQPDPIGYGDGLNLYAYVGNNPVNFVDPTGLFLDTLLDAAFIIGDLGILAWDELRNGGANRAVNLTALAVDTAAFAVPFATGAGVTYRTGNKLTKVAKKAEASYSGNGTAQARGTAIHKEFDRLVNDGGAGSKAVGERAYVDGDLVRSYRPKGSSNPDAVVGNPESPLAVFDLKTGASGISSFQRRKANENVGAALYELRSSGHSAPRPRTPTGYGFGANVTYHALK